MSIQDPCRLPAETAATRIGALRAELDSEGVDGLLVVDASNLRYLTGYIGEGVSLLITADEALALASHRNTARAEETMVGVEVLDVSEQEGGIGGVAGRLGLKRVGTEDHLPYARVLSQRRALSPVRQRPGDTVRRLRAVKDDAEIALLKESQRRAELVLDDFLQDLKPGLTEREAHFRLQEIIYAQPDLDGPSFPPIISSGPSAWTTHSHYTDRTMEPGDCVIIDMGVRWRGYCSDMTRTVFLGEPTPTMRKVYDLVLMAQQSALGAIRAGVKGRVVDTVARRQIHVAMGAESFDHGLGHGIGLDVHETPLPGLAAANRSPLEVGMAVTVEPGCYLPSEFGVRIEDTVIVREDGIDNLTQYTKELTIVG